MTCEDGTGARRPQPARLEGNQEKRSSAGEGVTAGARWVLVEHV